MAIATQTASNQTTLTIGGYTLETDAEFLARQDRGMAALKARLEREYPIGHDGKPAWNPRRTLADVERLNQVNQVNETASTIPASLEATQEGGEHASEATATSPANDATSDVGGIMVGAESLDLTRHDCTLTLISPRTGDHRTFRVKTVNKGNLNGKRIVSILTGPDNTEDYTGFATISDGTDGHAAGEIWVWSRYRGTSLFYEKYADMLARPARYAAKGVQYKAALRCRKCQRVLTNPTSLATGYGPECIKKVME